MIQSTTIPTSAGSQPNKLIARMGLAVIAVIFVACFTVLVTAARA